MKQFVVFLLLAVNYYGLYGQGAVIMQDKPFLIPHQIDSFILKQVGRGKAFRSMSVVEKEAVYWLAILRKDPNAFRTEVIKPFLSQFPELQGSAARSLDRELSSIGPLGILLPAENLDQAASTQATYLSQANRFTHTGPKGKPFHRRMEEVGVRDCAGENLFEGKADALVAVILLLIDNGVEGYGHRKALLNPSFTKVGVSAVQESLGTMMMVQVFSCQ